MYVATTYHIYILYIHNVLYTVYILYITVLHTVYTVATTHVATVYTYTYINAKYIEKQITTCKELRTVNIQANTLDSWLTASRPNTHVIPSKGSSITVAFKIVL